MQKLRTDYYIYFMMIRIFFTNVTKILEALLNAKKRARNK